jgi:hypothetical protein
MSYQIHADERINAQYKAREPRVTAVAVSSGIVLAFILFFAGFPLLVSAGLFLLGMALVFIAYAFVSFHRFAIPVWETALAGQAAGFVGLGLLFFASVVTV